MKNLKSAKSRLILSLASLIVLFGGLIPTLGIFSGGRQSAKASDVTFTTFPLPNGASSITNGPDGNLWFTNYYANTIGRSTLSGAVTEFPMSSTNHRAFNITTGPDGNLWFTEWDNGIVGRITPAGVITEFPLPTTTSTAWGITSGPDGNIWFTENKDGTDPSQLGKIGRITPAGVITEFPVPSTYNPTLSSRLFGITTGPDGNLWFPEWDNGMIGRITPTGAITEFGVPTGYPDDIIAGPDGNLWFTEALGDKIGRITPSGTSIDFSLPTTGSYPDAITNGPDGNLWFTELEGHKVGRITTSGAITEFSQFTFNTNSYNITAGADGNLWFTTMDSPDGSNSYSLVRANLSGTTYSHVNTPVNNLATDTTSTQSEASVAVSSVNSSGTTVMVGYNDTHNSEITGYSVSYDGGTRWKDMGALPHPTNWKNGGDPVLAVDRNGVFYFAQIAYIPGSSGKAEKIISLSKCTDSPKTGIKCGMPVQVSDAVPYNCLLFFCDNDKTGNDKPGIVYDPVSNRVFVTWTHYGYKTTKTNIIKLRSYNVSTGKLDPKTYNLYTAAAGSMNGSYPVVTSDGVVHVFFETGLTTQTSRFINYVKFKNGTISPLFTLAPVYPAGSLTSGCGRDALHTQAFDTMHAARTNEFPTAAVDKNGNIDVVWNANLPPGFGPAVSVIWVATLIHNTDTANLHILSESDKSDSTGTLLIQWQPTVAVTGATNTLVVTYFQVIQLADGTYRIERDMVQAPASAKPTFSSPSPISTQSWQPDKTNPNFNPGVGDCYMGDYDGSASTPTANVVWVYWGDSRNVTSGIGPQPDVWGLTV